MHGNALACHNCLLHLAQRERACVKTDFFHLHYVASSNNNVTGDYDVEAVLDKTAIFFLGTDVTDTDDMPIATPVVVGEQIALTTDPQPGTGQTPSWSVDGDPVGGYNLIPQTQAGDQPPPCAQVKTPSPAACAVFSPPVLNQSATTLYWVKPGTYKIRYQISGGTPRSATATFEVRAPSNIKIIVTTTNVRVLDNTSDEYSAYPEELWYLACGVLRKHDCVQFKAPDVVYSEGYKIHGSFQWVQLLPSITWTFVHKTGNARHCYAKGHSLDNIYTTAAPDVFSKSFDDAPAIGLSGKNGVINVGEVFQAETYLEWQSDSSNSIPVALGHLTWSWAGTAKINPDDSWTLTSPAVPPNVVGLTSSNEVNLINDYKYPTWKSVTLNGPCNTEE